jgi:chromosome segregation ATPase
LATSQAKAEAKAKAQAQDELVNVQSELVSVQGAFEKLQKRYDHTHKTNVQFLGELNQLDCEKKALVAEIDALREERAAAIDPAVEVQGQDGDQKAQKGHQEAQEAFKEKWVGVREATATERQHLPVVDVCGDQAVYSLGRGNFAIHTFAPGEVVPQLRNVTELQKGGIAGR